MNRALLQKEVQDFLEKNYKEDISRIVFKGSPFPGVSTMELAVQLTGKKKAEKKLPTWFNSQGIIFPPTLNLEQTSSEITAAYKATLIAGRSLLDVTGGFGIDSYFFSKKFKKIIHCELDKELSIIAAHNFKVLGIDNVQTFFGDGLEFLSSTTEHFDWIFIDPSRRDDTGGRIFLLSDTLPNVPQNLDVLLKKGENILIKTSPLLDIKAGIRELKNVHEVHVVSVENDVKELLWVLHQKPSKKLKVKTINFRKKGDQVYENYMHNDCSIDLSSPLSYLYEPNAALMKSGLFEALGEDFNLRKLHQNTQLYTSNELIAFPGRRFKIIKVVPYNRKKIKAAIDFEMAHISSRNFPESVAKLRNLFKLKDGGDHYLFFTTSLNEEKVLLVCEKA